MIAVTRLDGSALVLNAELIERIEATPDTVVTMTSGETFVVREAPTAIVDRVVEYRRAVLMGGPAVGAGAEQ
jgi:flagellar protein FlbD